MPRSLCAAFSPGPVGSGPAEIDEGSDRRRRLEAQLEDIVLADVEPYGPVGNDRALRAAGDSSGTVRSMNVRQAQTSVPAVCDHTLCTDGVTRWRPAPSTGTAEHMDRPTKCALLVLALRDLPC